MFRNKLFLSCIFMVLVLSRADASFLLDRVVAIVNQEVITWSELYRAMEADASPKVKAMKEEERKKVFKENEASFLNTLINLKLQLQEARHAGIRVTEEETKESIDNIKKKYSMDDDQFRDSLKSEGYTFEEYRKRLQEQIMVSKVVNQQIRNKIIISEADIDAFLKTNKEFAASAERYRIRQIFFKMPKDANDRIKTEERAEAVYAKILQGGSLPELAREYSEDNSRDMGGDLGFIDKGSLAKEFSDVLSVMKTGDVSKPFWTGTGMHIIKLEEQTSSKNAAELRENARKALNEKLFMERYNAWIKSLREQSFIDVRL
jgi:peptidyl-prolyl cis-trans isomerase SurA